jgi:hypothetical protein
MTNQNEQNQMELGFNGARTVNFAPQHRQQKLHRAKWWFAQMRRAVDSALDWQPTPAARPEQTWFPEQRGEIRLLPQHQVVE